MNIYEYFIQQPIITNYDLEICILKQFIAIYLLAHCLMAHQYYLGY